MGGQTDGLELWNAQWVVRWQRVSDTSKNRSFFFGVNLSKLSTFTSLVSPRHHGSFADRLFVASTGRGGHSTPHFGTLRLSTGSCVIRPIRRRGHDSDFGLYEVHSLHSHPSHPRRAHCIGTFFLIRVIVGRVSDRRRPPVIHKCISACHITVRRPRYAGILPQPRGTIIYIIQFGVMGETPHAARQLATLDQFGIEGIFILTLSPAIVLPYSASSRSLLSLFLPGA